MRRLALLVLLATAASAQVERGPLAVCRLPVAPASAEPGSPNLARRAAPTCAPGTEGARFEVTYTGFPDGAEAAFQRAVDVWACRIRSDQTIRVSATWSALERGTLGSAGPRLYRNFRGAPSRDVWYPAALADALTGRDLGDGEPDIEAAFNSTFAGWHTGSGPPPPDAYDLTTVVLHELAHGLGFIGALAVEDGVGRIGIDTDGPFSYDLHTRAASGTPLLDASVFPDGSAALARALQDPVLFSGLATRQSVGALALHAPDRWVPGGSYSHLDEDLFAPSTPDGLMTPFIARAELVEEPGTAVCAVLADVGWALAGDCARRVGAVPVASGEVTVERRGRNPFSTQTVLRLSVEQAVTVSLRVLDVRGRTVWVESPRVVASDRPWDVTIDGTGLASGVYFVEIRGAQAPVLVPLVVAR